MSNYPFVRIAEKYQDIESWKVELIYNMSGQDEAVTEEACWMLSNNGVFPSRSGAYSIKFLIDTLEDQINLIKYAKNTIRMRNSCD